MPRIVLEGVSKSFAGAEGKSVAAVDRLTLAVQDREWLALVGPSGCGKTTTLRLIAGLETIEAGRILFDETPVRTRPPVDHNVAMVFQSHALLPHLTAYDNLAFGLKLRHLPREEINSRIRETAGMLGITPCLARKPAELSGGERQRVALGRALVRRPTILLLDEPFSHLDEPLRVQLRTELLTLRSRLDTTMVYVTHDQVEALALGDRVAVLRQGKLQQVGSPAEVHDFAANTFVAEFIGSPPMNLFHGTVAQREGLHVVLGLEKSLEVPSPALVLALGDWHTDWFSKNVGRPVCLGVRPHSIRLGDQSSRSQVAPTLAGVMQSMEYLGAESILRLTAGGHGIVVRTDSPGELPLGQTATLVIDLGKARVYDAATGELLL